MITNQELQKAGMTIVRFASIARTLIRKNVSAAHATTISKKTGEAIDEWIKKQPEHVIYGSLPSYRQAFHARKPLDLDLAVDNLHEAATEILDIFKKKSKKESRIKETSYGYGIQIKENGEWTTAVDIHKLGTYHQKFVYGETLEPYEQNNLKIQRITTQLLRKAHLAMEQKQKIVTSDRHLKDTVDFINIARLLIESREVRQLAKIAKNKDIKEANETLINAKNAKEALKVWITYAQSLQSYGEKYKIITDAIPQKREKEFIAFSKKNPSISVSNLMFTNRDIEKVEPMPERNKKNYNTFDNIIKIFHGY